MERGTVTVRFTVLRLLFGNNESSHVQTAYNVVYVSLFLISNERIGFSSFRIAYAVYELKRMMEPYASSDKVELKCMYDIACILRTHLQVDFQQSPVNWQYFCSELFTSMPCKIKQLKLYHL